MRVSINIDRKRPTRCSLSRRSHVAKRFGKAEVRGSPTTLVLVSPVAIMLVSLIIVNLFRATMAFPTVALIININIHASPIQSALPNIHDLHAVLTLNGTPN